GMLFEQVTLLQQVQVAVQFSLSNQILADTKRAVVLGSFLAAKVRATNHRSMKGGVEWKDKDEGISFQTVLIQFGQQEKVLRRIVESAGAIKSLQVGVQNSNRFYRV